MQQVRMALWVLCVTVAMALLAIEVRAAEQKQYAVSAAGAGVTVDPASGVVRSVVLNGQQEMARPHPAGSEQPFGWVQVTDLYAGRTYSPTAADCQYRTLSHDRIERDGGTEVMTTQQYEGAPFFIEQTFRQTPAGVRWEARLQSHPEMKENRSVVVTWVLPLPQGWKFWGPSNLDVHTTNGVSPFRYLYGHTDSSPMCTVIPLVGVWSKEAGAAIFSPPDIRKSQIVFEVHTQGLPDVGTGVFRHVEDLQSLRVSYHQVGLRPGKDLTFAITLAGTRPDWRGVLGHYVSSYPELFEPIPQTRQWEGMYGITTPRGWLGLPRRGETAAQTQPAAETQGAATQSSGRPRRQRGRPGRASENLVNARATCVEVHCHFLEYGYFINQEFIDNPDKEFECVAHPNNGPNSYNQNRRVFREMMDNGVGPFVYFYNVHSLPATIKKRYPGEMMLDERGRPAIQWHTEPAVVAQPDSAFGRNLLDQIRLLVKAYPEVPGFFVDNYAIQKIDFAHDDGVTMVHNKPCYDLNRNHQDIGTRCFEIAHQAGKVMMVNKLATIESARGADMVLVEGADPHAMMTTALACVSRPFFPLIIDRRGEDWAERMLKLLLVWGGTPGTELMLQAETTQAYRPLTDCLIGKRWVFDADPLTLPAGYQGQIFRIDPAAPHAGDVVVTVVNPARSWQDRVRVEDLTVTVRLPEAEQLTTVTWLPVEKSQDPAQTCEFTRDGQAIIVKLPPVGAAGVLRLSSGLVPHADGPRSPDASDLSTRN